MKLSDKNELKMWKAICGIVLVSVTFIIAHQQSTIYYYEQKVGNEKFALDIACLDGCYNQLEIAFGNLGYYSPKKWMYDKCAESCGEKYIGGGLIWEK